jgi:hypothetical protein
MGERATRQRGAFRARATLRGLLLAAAAFADAASAGAAPCTARSGERTVPLVELYVTQRCAGCQEAERWLSGLAAKHAPQEMLPVVSYVDYADYLQQSDRSAAPRVAQRERKLLLRQRMALVYTPQVLLQGRPFQPWDGPQFLAAVRHIKTQPARARLALELRPGEATGLAAHVEAQLLEPTPRASAVLFMAAVERRPQGAPPRVLEWQGPFAPGPNGRFAEERRLSLLPGAARADSGVAAFVQDRRTAEVLQALLLPACSP